MAAADYRLMTEATGQRIAAALEALHLATVTGVKGDAEANYRTGDVSITPANIGALKNKATYIEFNGSETGLATSIIAKLDTMSIYEMLPINTYCNATTANFSNGTTYTGFLYKLDTKFASGFISNNAQELCMLSRNGNDTITFKRVVGWSGIVPVPAGGTGANNVLGALQNLFNVPNTDAGYLATTYPTAPGIYMVQSDIFNNMNGDAYGTLIIFKVYTYNVHLFISAFGKLYYGFSETGVVTEPATWYLTNATAQS